MQEFIRRIVLGLATGMGYVPAGKPWRDRLQTLHGEFRRSGSEKLIRSSLEGVVTATGALLLGRGYAEYARIGSVVLLPLSAVGTGLIAAAFYFLTRNGDWYKIERASMSAFTENGRLRWTEDLAGLTDVVCTRGRATTVMVLHWSGRKRRIDLYDSLQRALAASS